MTSLELSIWFCAAGCFGIVTMLIVQYYQLENKTKRAWRRYWRETRKKDIHG